MSFRKKLVAGLLSACMAVSTFAMNPIPVAAATKTVTVCIDPGHGGSNMGAQYKNLNEKDITLQIALAMYQELSKYEGVNIVMTRVDDTELSLAQRAEIAKANNADFLYSIHLNASVEHNFFGSEIWTSCYGNYYAKGAAFGQLELAELSALGIYSKGVKSKINGTLSADYYGVIKNSVERKIPAVIIEHCYMDETVDDAIFRNTEALGKADATAVAKYFGLKSKTLGVDYKKYPKPSVKASKAPRVQDETPPEVSSIAFNSYNEAAGTVNIHIAAQDSQSPIIYYNYSIDGGKTWTRLSPWLAGAEADIDIKAPHGSTMIFNVWNQYEKCSYSNSITF